MRFAKFLVLAAGVAALVTLAANGQPPPGGPKGDKGLKGPKGGKAPNTNSEQLLDDLALSDASGARPATSSGARREGPAGRAAGAGGTARPDEGGAERERL